MNFRTNTTHDSQIPPWYINVLNVNRIYHSSVGKVLIAIIFLTLLCVDVDVGAEGRGVTFLKS